MPLPPLPPAGPATGTHRLAGLDALRGLAALSIAVLHVWLYTTTTSAERSGVVEGFFHELRLALPLFFVLSGFLIYRAWVAAVLDGRPRPALRRYAAARARRLGPGAWACLLVTAPLLVTFDEVRGVSVPDAAALPLFAVFAQAFHPQTAAQLNPPMWTLTVEASFYLVLPALGALGLALAHRRPGRVALLAPAVLLGAIGFAWNVWLTRRGTSIVLSSALPALAPCFAAGMVAAVLAHGRALSPAIVRALLATGALLVLTDGWWHESGTAASTDAGRVIRDAPAAVGFALVLAAVAHATRPSRLLAARPLTWLGERSYGVYLWHMPVIYGLRASGTFPEGDLALALAAVLAVTLPIAHISWTLVERPALTWRRRRAPRAHPRPNVHHHPFPGVAMDVRPAALRA